MADASSNIKKWISFGWDAKSAAIIEMAKTITELGKTNPDYALFAPEWLPFYGITTNVAWGKMVDPDDVEPYVNAWIAWASENRATFSAPAAKSAMVNAGLDDTKSYVVANAMWRLWKAGNLPLIIEAPAGWASTAGVDASDVGEVLDNLAVNIKSGVMTGTNLVKYLPWVAVAVGAFVAWPYVAPYIAGARALARRRTPTPEAL